MKTMSDGMLRVGELSKLSGVSTDTLRHYERKGVLPRPARSRNGYREYECFAIERVRLVRRALSVGFTLDELARILRARDRGAAPCKEVRALASQKLEDIERQLADLSEMRDDLRRAIREWDRLIAKVLPGEPARLLDSLASDGSARAGRSLTLTSPRMKRTSSKENQK